MRLWELGRWEVKFTSIRVSALYKGLGVGVIGPFSKGWLLLLREGGGAPFRVYVHQNQKGSAVALQKWVLK